MTITILVATLLLINVDLFSQGGVNVKYIAIDTVDKSLIGQKVKIDFRSSNGTKEYLMQKARIGDTVTISVDKRLINLIERKGQVSTIGILTKNIWNHLTTTLA